MQPTLCTRCHKNFAVVFISKLEGDRTINEGLCLSCARKMGLPQVDEMIKRFGIPEEDMDNFGNEMMQAFDGPENLEDLTDDDEDENHVPDEEEQGKTATFPFLNRLFSGGDTNRPEQEPPRNNNKKDAKNKNNNNQKVKRKYLESYCISLTDRARKGKLDPVVGRD